MKRIGWGRGFTAIMWFATVKRRCKDTGCKKTDPAWTQRSRCLMPWISTCGYLNSAFLVRKQKFWKLCKTVCKHMYSPVVYVVVLGTNKFSIGDF